MPFKSIIFPNKLTSYLPIIFFISALTSFILLGLNGIGIFQWIFNNRYAYIVGRVGNGIYYISFQLFIALTLVSLLVSNYRLIYKFTGIFILIVLSYLTGSKAFLLGVIIFIIMYYDLYTRKIKLPALFLLGIIGVLSLNILLFAQSNISLIDYGGLDFYNNYLQLIQSIISKDLPYFNGLLNFEDSYVNLIPRGIFSQKPFIYGHSRLVAYFYGDETV